mgnify:CR=1 FL=1
MDPEKTPAQGGDMLEKKAGERPTMSISFEIPQDIEQQLRAEGVDLNREARQVFLMEQYRRAKITHRQLEEALDLSFYETEELLKQRGMGQDRIDNM